MARKTAVHNDRAPDMRGFFNWGLKISDMDELFIATGRPAWAADGSVVSPGDAVRQTQYILEDMEKFLAEAGYAKDDLIRIEYTFTKEVGEDQYEAVFRVFADWLKDVAVKPAASTLRIVDGLALAGLVVEYEFWTAK
ncbi:MAG: RidA family protein [Alphaproteobacteria bacterium]